MRRTIAILGAGFSGAITAVQLLRQGRGRDLAILLVERSGTFGRGLAYGTWDDNFLLNVPAGNMSALAEEPGHFVAYIRNIDPSFNPGSFVPRRIYGDYLEDLLERAQREGDARLTRITGDAVALDRSPSTGEFTVDLADGRQVAATQVVLAFGHFLPARPESIPGTLPQSAYVADPWNFAALDRLDPARPVILLGSGHTAIDALFRLTSNNATRPAFLLSRHGLLPQGHRMTPRPPSTGPEPSYLGPVASLTARGLIRAIRGEVRRRAAAGADWRDVINELRPHTPGLWHRLPLRERRIFLSRLVPYWDVHRHRLAPAASLRLHRLIDAGRVQVLAGRIAAIETLGTGLRAHVRRRAGGATAHIDAGAIVNCTGPRYDLGPESGPLVAHLVSAGFLQRDALQLGPALDDEYGVLDRAGRAVPGLFYIGPMLKARYWEAIAVPELRVHGARLARRLLAQA
jgi:uncharacterized NAD(P)/FAD-binding protein YdhS